MDFITFQKSLMGRKIQKQVKAAHRHIRWQLGQAGKLVELGTQGAYLAVDDAGKIVCRYCTPGQNPGPYEHGEH
jgi:hypothetical protein